MASEPTSSALDLLRRVDRHRVQHAHQFTRVDAHQQATPATVDLDGVELEDGALDEHRHRLARAEG
jgi:hypothetical protein